MPNINIFQSLPCDKDIIAMQQPESLLVSSKSNSLDSSLISLRHQENKSKRHQNHQQQEQEQEQEQEKDKEQEKEQEQEQEKFQYGSRRKRKWEYDDAASCVETPRKSNTRSYCPPRPPRKPKATPAMKRRAMWYKRSVDFLDVAKEVESMFPLSVLQDFGKKIKKATS